MTEPPPLTQPASLPLPLLTTFGLGYMRPFPGTWGSLPPVAAAAVMIAAGLGPDRAFWLYHGVLTGILLVFSLACIIFGDRAEARFGRKDASQIVADETAGQCLPLMFLPAAALQSPATAVFTLVFAFLAFRAMDILKPWPAHGLQSAPGGWGVLLDDLAAGLQALILLQLVVWIAL
jgi:phosphatidylglycerophosphatase A